MARLRQKVVGSYQFTGGKELEAALAQLTRATERNVLKRAAAAGIAPIAEQARSLVPVRTGKLKGSIAVKVGVDDPGYRARARAAFVATGSARGVKRSKGGGYILAQLTVGGASARHAGFVERGTIHMHAHPYLRPAFDGEVGAAKERVAEVLRVEIGKATARRARKLAKAAP